MKPAGPVTLTQALIRKLAPTGAAYDVYDADLSGLALRVYPSGTRSYRMRLIDKTKMQETSTTTRTLWYWWTLGPADAFTGPEHARRVAKKRMGEVADDKDPRQARKEARANARKSITLERFITDHYEPWVTAQRKTGAETIARLNSRFAGLLSTRLDELTAFAVERWRTARIKDDGARPATINRDLGALKSALARAVEWKRIDQHPLASVKPAKVDSRGIIRYLGGEEEKRLVKALQSRDERRRKARESANKFREERDYDLFPAFGTYTDILTPLVHVALTTGLRFGELCNLKWQDIDLGPSALLAVHGAGAKSGQTRMVPLNDHAVEVLKVWRPTDAKRDDFVFSGRDDERLTEIKTAWKRITREAKVTEFRFHDLRHTFASKLVQVGIDLNTVRELLGHADIKQTLRYAHLAPEQRRAAVDKIAVM